MACQAVPKWKVVGLFEIVFSTPKMLFAQKFFKGVGGATHIAYAFHNSPFFIFSSQPIYKAQSKIVEYANCAIQRLTYSAYSFITYVYLFVSTLGPL